MRTFEDCLPEIDEEIAKRRSKWQMNPVTQLDFEDVEQILRLHIYEKWNLWDQDRPLRNWLNRVITNRLMNLVRDNYSNLAPPCSRCPMNQGANLCSGTPSGIKCGECPLYSKWEKYKKNGYEMRLSSSLDDPDNLASFSVTDPKSSLDLESATERFVEAMRGELSETNFKAFQKIYIEGLDEEVVAKMLGFTSSESGRKAGYKQIYNIKRKIKEVAVATLKKSDVIYE